jgi:hypothetical protein
VNPLAVQRAAIVALGLVSSAAPDGYPLRVEEPSDPLDVAAILLNAVLVAPQSAAKVAAGLELRLSGRAASIAATVRIRCELSRFLTAAG